MKTSFWNITAIIVILAFSLRAYGLGSNSLWVDELFTLRGVRYGTLEEMVSWLYGEEYSDGVGFYIVEWFSFRVPFLPIEASLRLAPMIFSIATVPFIGLIARRFFDERVAYYSMLFFSVSITQVYFAQEARPYSGIVFFTTLSTYLWLNFIFTMEEDRGGKSSFAGYIIVTSLGCYFDFALIMVVLAHLFSSPLLTGFNSPKMKWQAICTSAILILFSPGIYRFIGVLENRPNYMSQPSIYFFRDYQIMHYNSWELFFWVSFALFVFYFIRCLYLVEWERSVSDRINQFLPEIFFASWLILPVFVLVFYSWLTEPAVNSKRVLFTSPASYILLSRASLELGKIIRKTDLVSVVLVSTLLSHSIYFSGYYSESQKQPIREGVEYLHENSDGLAVFTYPDSHFFASYSDSISSGEDLRWHSSGEKREVFVETVRQEGFGWILIAENKNRPFDVNSLVLEIGNEAHISEVAVWKHADRLNEGWVEVRLFLTILN